MVVSVEPTKVPLILHDLTLEPATKMLKMVVFDGHIMEPERNMSAEWDKPTHKL